MIYCRAHGLTPSLCSVCFGLMFSFISLVYRSIVVTVWTSLLFFTMYFLIYPTYYQHENVVLYIIVMSV